MSHPAWVCGLKHVVINLHFLGNRHTLRGCVDWNFLFYRKMAKNSGHTLRGCVDWNLKLGVHKCTIRSHPAWVCGLKLFIVFVGVVPKLSHPAWVCGLKHTLLGNNAPHNLSHPAWVCGLKQMLCQYMRRRPWSHPAWVCGLKQTLRHRLLTSPRHTLRGCVDWNFCYQWII